MGRVRCGFDVSGVIYYAHEFMNSNVLSVPYMQTASLPIGMVVTSTGSATTKTSYFKCATVHSESGKLENHGFIFSTPENTATAGNGTRVPLIAIRPKTTFNGITNRQLLVPLSVALMVTGTSNVFWELVIG